MRRSAIRASDAAYTDASFIRLKTLQVAYTFPERVKRSLHLENLRLFLQGPNLQPLTGSAGTDPEVQNPFALPQLRIITGGIQIQL